MRREDITIFSSPRGHGSTWFVKILAGNGGGRFHHWWHSRRRPDYVKGETGRVVGAWALFFFHIGSASATGFEFCCRIGRWCIFQYFDTSSVMTWWVFHVSIFCIVIRWNEGSRRSHYYWCRREWRRWKGVCSFTTTIWARWWRGTVIVAAMRAHVHLCIILWFISRYVYR